MQSLDQVKYIWWVLNLKIKMLEAVLFDVIGTTVIEKDPNTIMNCFEKAFRDNGVLFAQEFVRSHRGKDKSEMISLVIEKQGLQRSLIRKVFESFQVNVENSVENFVAHPAANDLFKFLKSSGIKVGLGTGLSRRIFNAIVNASGLDLKSVDYMATLSEMSQPRPDPEMIFHMMRKLKVSTKDVFLKIGDTVADIEEGKNAGVMTAVVLAGTQSDNLLREQNPDFVFTDLGELKNILISTPNKLKQLS
jgi:phosphonatase-like hydrolase